MSRMVRCIYKRTVGFTLVELLVVVAIIALLVSILLPSLGKAKEQTRTTMCLTNLKGLHLAFVYYAQENDDWYPAGCGIGGDPPTWDYILRDDYHQFGLLHCPSDRLERASWYEARGIPKGSRYPRSYAINRSVTWMGPSDYDPNYWPGSVHKIKDVTDPGETIILGEQWEAAYWSAYRPGMYTEYHGCGIFTHWETYWPGRGPTLDVHSNNDRANYLFCDGRVTTIMADDPDLGPINEYYYWTRTKN